MKRGHTQAPSRIRCVVKANNGRLLRGSDWDPDAIMCMSRVAILQPSFKPQVLGLPQRLYRQAELDLQTRLRTRILHHRRPERASARCGPGVPGAGEPVRAAEEAVERGHGAAAPEHARERRVQAEQRAGGDVHCHAVLMACTRTTGIPCWRIGLSVGLEWAWGRGGRGAVLVLGRGIKRGEGKVAETVVSERDVGGDVPRAEVVARCVARDLVAICGLPRGASVSANIDMAMR